MASKVSYRAGLYSHQTCALLSWGLSGHKHAAKIDCAHRRACKLLIDCNQNIPTFHSIDDYFDSLQVFNTNKRYFHQYFKDKLSSHQSSHMH